MPTSPPDLQLNADVLFHRVFSCVWQFVLQDVTPFCNLPPAKHLVPLSAFSTYKARKLHQYFIGGSIFLYTDSVGKEINSWVLIMQCGDTDLILSLSTCTDILMHSARLLSSTQEVFMLFVQTLEKKINFLPLTEVTSLPQPPKDINEYAGAALCAGNTENTYLHFHRNHANAKWRSDNSRWQLSRCLEGELREALTGD